MKLKEILARTILASSLLNNCYAQSSVEDYFIDKIDNAASEKIIGEAIDRLITKPEITEREGFWREDLSGCGLIVNNTPFYRQTAGINDWKEITQEAPCLSYGYDKKNGEFIFSIEAPNVNSRHYSNNLTTPERKAILGIPRLNLSETKLFVFHLEEAKPTINYELARYLSEKEETLKPLEESKLHSAVQRGGKTLVVKILEGLKIYNAEKYLETAEEKYLAREQEVMNGLAKEISPLLVTTKIPLYPAKIFGDKEIERTISLKLEKINGYLPPTAIYLKVTFGDPETGIGSYEYLFKNNLLD